MGYAGAPSCIASTSQLMACLVSLVGVACISCVMHSLPLSCRFNTWNSFGCGSKMTAANILKVAEIMVSSGLKDAGYDYLNLDDCWAAKSRAADGSIVGDPIAFPNMTDLARKVRAHGLRFGLYTSENSESAFFRATLCKMYTKYIDIHNI
jgi:alpha-galactosidase